MVRYYLVRAWIWLVFAWQQVKDFAPWKAIIFAYLAQMAISFVLNVVCVMAFGAPMPRILDLIVFLVVFVLVYRSLFKRFYPNGWQG